MEKGRRSGAGAAALVALAVAVPVLVAVPPAIGEAQENGDGEEPSLLVLLDTRVDERAALSSVIAGLPPGAPVGVTAFDGAGGNGAEACGEGRVVLPVGPLVPAAAEEALGTRAPSPPAALGMALEQAVDALPPRGPGTVVLVAGGHDGCEAEDPCGVARGLAASDPSLRVEVVGFGVDHAAAEQLTCVAEATGGDFWAASDAAALAQAVRFVAVGVVGATQTQGLRAEGGVDPDSAPTLQADQYLDRIEPGGARAYAVELVAGEQLRASATLVRAGGQEAQEGQVTQERRTLRAQVLDPAQRAVASDEEVGEGRRLGSVSVSSGVVGPSAGGRWYVTLDLEADEGFEVELLLDVLDEDVVVAATAPPASAAPAAARPAVEGPFLGTGAGLAVSGTAGAAVGFLVGAGGWRWRTRRRTHRSRSRH